MCMDGLSLHVISFNSAMISACEKGRLWQHLAPLPDEMHRDGLCDQHQLSHLSLKGGSHQLAQVISFNAAMSACDTGWALAACDSICQRHREDLLLGVVSFNTAMSACDKGWASAAYQLVRPVANGSMRLLA
eukprot:8790273-Karenia_brevis.AAC.1